MKALVLTAAQVIALPADHPEAENKQMGRIQVPVGFRPTGMIQRNDGEVVVIGLKSPNGVLVDHRVVLVGINDQVQPLLGWSVGDHLGDCMIPSKRGSAKIAQVFQLLPWPTEQAKALIQ